MLGAIIGDIAGSRFEFDNYKVKDFELFDKNCFFTDDTVMTVAVADTLLRFDSVNNDTLFKKVLCERMRYYGKKYSDCSYGFRFGLWLCDDSAAPYYSFGNGSAMRVSPVSWYSETLETTEYIAKLTAEVTHNHPEGIKGAQAVAAAIWLARNNYDKAQIKQYIENKYYPIDFCLTLDDIRPIYEFDETCQGTVPVALEAFFEAENFEDSIKNAVSVGGDSDTLAAITGSVAEAYYGIEKTMIKKAKSYLDEEIIEVVNTFNKKYISK